LHQQALLIEGVEFNDNPDLAGVLKGLRWSGFQASHLGKAVDQINEMVAKLCFFFVSGNSEGHIYVQSTFVGNPKSPKNSKM
jgi:deoxyhypusine synthase